MDNHGIIWDNILVVSTPLKNDGVKINGFRITSHMKWKVIFPFHGSSHHQPDIINHHYSPLLTID